MTNKEIAGQFSMLAKLMDVHDLDSFKAKSYSNAAFRIRQLDQEIATLPAKELMKIPGIGVAIAKKIAEIIEHGSLPLLDELMENTPQGILEMVKIKGLGAKKIFAIWKTMGIDNVIDLLNAARENKLVNYPGFGARTQQNIMEAIAYYLQNRESLLYAQAEEYAGSFLKYLAEIFPSGKAEITGEVRRQSETVSSLDILISEKPKTLLTALSHEGFLPEENTGAIRFKSREGVNIRLFSIGKQSFAKVLFDTTGPEAFITEFQKRFPAVNRLDYSTENEIFSEAGLPLIPPSLRETAGILDIASANAIPDIIQPDNIKGLIHCHTNWSDGLATIEQMANGCISRGLEYMVLTDHSKAAFYAQGLSEERIAQQQAEIDKLNKRLAPFRIFKSIECDILSDGTLDYDDATLKTFDLVIASIHSNQNMPAEKATQRLLRAIENPHTTILGHMTGRLLLMRRGYMPDHKKVIDACAANGVVIEINANPRRLDMRWQWVPYALDKGVLLSINPDAHSVEEIDKIRYGVLVAQKGLLTKDRNLSSFSLKEFESFLKRNNTSAH